MEEGSPSVAEPLNNNNPIEKHTAEENGTSEKTLSKREKKELRRQQQTKQEKKDKKTDETAGTEEEHNQPKKNKSKNKESEAGEGLCDNIDVFLIGTSGFSYGRSSLFGLLIH